MRHRKLLGATTIAVVLLMPVGVASAFDDSKYPDLRGQWLNAGESGLLRARFDESKPLGLPPSLGQQPPLTAEYQAIWERNLTDIAGGGQGIITTYSCLARGMPQVMVPWSTMEFVIAPETTYILFGRDQDFYRHVYTDDRDFPDNMGLDPQYLGYSIGRWVDLEGSGRYDTLIVETRGLKGPRTYDMTGIPFHADNQTIVKERISVDKTNPNLLHNEITTIDHALTRPWVVERTYRRAAKGKTWAEHQVCAEGNAHVRVGKEVYYLSADGLLMPAKKDQPPPDLRYFKQRQ